MVKLVYFAAAVLMLIFAVITAIAKGLLWGLALAVGALALVFLGLSKDEEDAGGTSNARR